MSNKSTRYFVTTLFFYRNFKKSQNSLLFKEKCLSHLHKKGIFDSLFLMLMNRYPGIQILFFEGLLYPTDFYHRKQKPVLAYCHKFVASRRF